MAPSVGGQSVDHGADAARSPRGAIERLCSRGKIRRDPDTHTTPGVLLGGLSFPQACGDIGIVAWACVLPLGFCYGRG